MLVDVIRQPTTVIEVIAQLLDEGMVSEAGDAGISGAATVALDRYFYS